MADGKRKNKSGGGNRNKEFSSSLKKGKHHRDDSPSKISLSKPNKRHDPKTAFNNKTKSSDSSDDRQKSKTNNKGNFNNKKKPDGYVSDKKNNKIHKKTNIVKHKNNKAGGGEKSTSQQHREQKQARQSQRKHADAVSHAKVLWNQLRQKRLSPDQRRDIMKQLMPLITGKVTEICGQHDAARVVQAALQFGTIEQRRLMIHELTAQPGTLAELAKSPYAHFCVLKAIQYTHKDDDCISRILKNLMGSNSKSNSSNNTKTKNDVVSVPKLAMHAVACRVIEALFTTLPNKKLIPLKMELFGPHVTLFATAASTPTPNHAETTQPAGCVTLESCLAQIPEAHRQATISFVRDLIHKGMDKTLYALNFFQELMREYGSVVSGAEIRALLAHGSSSNSNGNGDGGGSAAAPSPCDHAVHLLSSRAGAKVMCDWISYGTAKDRKSIAKSLKGFARSALLHPQGSYLALIRLVQLTDDTVTLHKFIFQELLSNSPPTPPAVTTDQQSKGTKATLPPKCNTTTDPPTNSNDESGMQSSSKVNTVNDKNDAAKNEKINDDKDDADDEKKSHPLLELALSEQASKFLLFILLLQNHDALRKVLDPYEWSVLQPGVIPIVESIQNSKEEEGREDKRGRAKAQPTSKKDDSLRQKELFKYLQQPLIDLCVQHPKELLLSRSGSVVLRHVYHLFRPSALVEAVLAAAVTVDPPTTTSSEEQSPPQRASKGEEKKWGDILQDRIGHLSIKNLILADTLPALNGESKSTPTPEPLFAIAFWERMMKQHQPQSPLKKSLSSKSKKMPSPWTQLALSGNRGAFVVAALVQVLKSRRQLHRHKMDLDQTSLGQRLQSHDNNGEKVASDGMAPSSSDSVAGIRALLKEIEGGKK